MICNKKYYTKDIRIIDMRNKIIALILTVVMATLALASCAGSYNYAEENIGDHVTFDAAAFKEALKAIEIADSDFTLSTLKGGLAIT